jgi:phage terminase large subunit GpA-like protein
VVAEEIILNCDRSCPDFKPGCAAFCKEYHTYNQAYNDGLKPIIHKHISQFADNEVNLPTKGNKEPGHWRTNRTPYLREILDNLGPLSKTQYTRVVKGTQLGFTTVALIWFAYIVKYAAANMLMLMPTLTNAKRHSKGKVAPFIEANPDIFKGRIKDPKDKEGGNEMYCKEYPGGELILSGANSAAALRHFTTKYAVRDEKDGYPADVEGEGDPGELIECRTDIYGSEAKYYDLSTPTITGMSPISDDYQDSDQRVYMVPCPNCQIKQKLVWENIVYEHDNYQLTTEVFYRCEHCRTLIAEHNKTWMLAEENGAEWIAQNPGHEKRGYHLSSLYSPLGWLSWKKMVCEYLKAMKNHDAALLKRFWNTRLALCWNEEETPLIDESSLYTRRESYGPEIPLPALILTAAIDVQSSPARLEIEIKAHGPEDESWTIDYHIIDADPGKKQTWEELAGYLWEEKRYHAGGAEMKIAIALIDSGGHFSQEVYDFCAKYRRYKAFCTKGSQFPGKPIIERARRRKGGFTSRVDFFIGTDTAKDTIFSRLQIAQKETKDIIIYAGITSSAVTRYPGYMHFNESCDEEYFAQLVAEKREKVKVGRRYVWRYRQIRDRNEALDLNVLNLAAVRILRPNWMKLARDIAARAKVEKVIVNRPGKSGIISPALPGATVVPGSARSRRRVLSNGIRG